MTWEELADKQCNSTSVDSLFYVDLPNKLWAIVEKDGNVELHCVGGGEDVKVVSMAIFLGKKTYEQIDKLLEGLKGEAK